MSDKVRTFERWAMLVDDEIERIAGVTSSDLEDCAYRDWYNRGVTPEKAAKKALRNSGFKGAFS